MSEVPNWGPSLNVTDDPRTAVEALTDADRERVLLRNGPVAGTFLRRRPSGPHLLSAGCRAVVLVGHGAQAERAAQEQ